ncbi:MAG: TAXI family TRAP transporter solute-binding subunit [Acidobacteriota bacterium]
MKNPVRLGVSLSLLLVLVLGAVSCSSGENSGGSTTVVTLASSPPGGMWYVVGGVLTDLITDSAPQMRAIAEVTSGAVENTRLVGTGQSDMGFTIVKLAQQGFRGEPPFDQPFPDLRMLYASVEVGRLHMVVLKESPLKDICGVKGLQVAVGPAGHGSIPNLREIFSAGCGFSFEDISPVYLPYGQSLTSLGDRRVDVAVLYVSPPVAAISEFGAVHDYRILPVSQEAREKVLGAYSYYLDVVVPADAYQQVTEEIPTVGTANGVVANANVPDEVIYQVIKATFENLDVLRRSHPTLENFGLENAATGGLIPYHEGAIRYYREQGVWPEPEEVSPEGAGEDASTGTASE